MDLTVRDHLRKTLSYMTEVGISFEIYLEEFAGVEAPAVPDEVFDRFVPAVAQRHGEQGITWSPRRVVTAKPFYPAFQIAKENGWKVARIDILEGAIYFARNPIL